MSMREEMLAAYKACTSGVDQPDWIVFAGYEEYVAQCQRFGLTPLPEDELLHLVGPSND